MSENPTVGGDVGVWGGKLNNILDIVRPGAERGSNAVTAEGTRPFKVFQQATDPAVSGLVEDGDWWVRIP